MLIQKKIKKCDILIAPENNREKQAIDDMKICRTLFFVTITIATDMLLHKGIGPC
jgi:hypothetical protein